MKNSQIIAERIKLICKSKKITVKKCLEICDLGPNTVQKLSNGTDIFSRNLAKIADELECSVDYLLGRSDNPKLSSGNTSINQQYIGGDANAHIIGDKSSLIAPQKQELQDEMTTELIKAFKKLDFADKIEIMNAIFDKIKK